MHGKYMEIALAEALEAAKEGEIPVGAVIVKDGEIIASAHNNREATGDATGPIFVGYEAVRTWYRRTCRDRKGLWSRRFPKKNQRNGFCQRQ